MWEMDSSSLTTDEDTMFVCMGVSEIHSSIQQIIEPGPVFVMKFKPGGTGKTIHTVV